MSGDPVNLDLDAVKRKRRVITAKQLIANRPNLTWPLAPAPPLSPCSEHKVEVYDAAFKYVRTGAAGGPSSRALWPIIGFKSSGDTVTLKGAKWFAMPGEAPAAHVGTVLEAATLLQTWDEGSAAAAPPSSSTAPPAAAASESASTVTTSTVTAPLPTLFLREAYALFRGMYDLEGGRGRLSHSTRAAGAKLAFDRSGAACAAALRRAGVTEAELIDAPGLRGGDRLRLPRGEATVLGVSRGKLWYVIDSSPETGAYYWSGPDLEEQVRAGMAARLPRPTRVQAEADAEAAAASSSEPGGVSQSEGSISFETFCGWATDPLWRSTLAPAAAAPPSLDATDDSLGGTGPNASSAAGGESPDEALVRLVNQQCDREGVEPAHLLLRRAGAGDGSFPAWAYEVPPDSTGAAGDPTPTAAPLPLPHLRARFAVLLALNRRLARLLPLADLTLSRPGGLVTTDPRGIRYTSALGRRVARLRGLVFTRVKLAHWTALLRATAEYTQPAQDIYERPEGFPELKLSRVKARPDLLEALPSRGERVRQSLFGQLMTATRTWSDTAFRRAYSHVQDAGQRRAFFVKLLGEGVDDNGGPYRAALQTAAAEEPAGVLGFFVPCPNGESKTGGNWDRVVFAPLLPDDVASTVAGALAVSSGGASCATSAPAVGAPHRAPGPSHRALTEYRFLGLLSATALRDGVLLPLNLSPTVWRPLVGLPVRHADLAAVDTGTASALQAVLGVPHPAPSDEGTTALLLEALRSRASEAVTRLGSHAPRHAAAAASALDFRTRAAFVRHMRLAAVRRGHSAAHAEAFLAGLGACLPSEALPLFTPGEAETLFCGRPDVDVELLKRVTEYEFVGPTDPHIVAFWEVLSEFTQEQRAAFVNFVSARSRLPPSADAFLMPLKIEAPSGPARDKPDDWLPKSATCFMRLSLPKYSSKDVLRSKLLTAIAHSWSMDADVRLTTAEGYDALTAAAAPPTATASASPAPAPAGRL